MVNISQLLNMHSSSELLIYSLWFISFQRTVDEVTWSKRLFLKPKFDECFIQTLPHHNNPLHSSIYRVIM